MSLTGEGTTNNNNNSSLQTPDPNGGSTRPKPANPTRISYRECQKNHAANIGGNVTDGCGEFMPSGDDGTLEALKCAACSCHRNFHRKEHHGGGGGAADGMLHALHLTPPPPLVRGGNGGVAAWAPPLLPFGAAGTDSSSEEMNFNNNNNIYQSAAVAAAPYGAKKRFRTKFTAEQKEKMMAFAVKIGWRIPREDDTELQRFCGEVGVKRQVFKVWMHNNKISSTTTTTSSKSTTPQQF